MCMSNHILLNKELKAIFLKYKEIQDIHNVDI